MNSAPLPQEMGDARGVEAAGAKGLARALRIWLTLGMAAVAALVLAMSVGSSDIPVLDVIRLLLRPEESSASQVIHELRLPRALAAFAAGGLLALRGRPDAGAAAQPARRPLRAGSFQRLGGRRAGRDADRPRDLLHQPRGFRRRAPHRGAGVRVRQSRPGAPAGPGRAGCLAPAAPDGRDPRVGMVSDHHRDPHRGAGEQVARNALLADGGLERRGFLCRRAHRAAGGDRAALSPGSRVERDAARPGAGARDGRARRAVAAPRPAHRLARHRDRRDDRGHRGVRGTHHSARAAAGDRQRPARAAAGVCAAGRHAAAPRRHRSAYGRSRRSRCRWAS